MRFILITCLLYFLFPIFSIGQHLREKTLELNSVFFVDSDCCKELNGPYLDSIIIDSVAFNYKSTQDSLMFTYTYLIVHDSNGSYFVKNNMKTFLFDKALIENSLFYENIYSKIKLKLKGSGPKGMPYGGSSGFVSISFLVNNKGDILEKCIEFFGEEYPGIRRKFMRSNFTFTPWLLRDEPRNVLYNFSFSPTDF